MSGKERLSHVLRAIAENGGEITVHYLAGRTGWPLAVAQHAMKNAKALDFAKTVRMDGHVHVVGMTDAGRARLARLSPESQAPAAASLSSDLARSALALISKAEKGMDSGTVARELATSTEAVEAALREHVEAHRLVCCGVQRRVEGEMKPMQHYRLSVGGTLPYDWRVQGQATWENRKADQAAALQPVRPIAEQDLTQAPTKAQSAAESETVSEVLDAVTPPPPARGVPYLGEIDIDAVHRKQPRAPALAAHCDPEFTCYVDSDGDMLIRSFGTDFELPLPHVLKLRRYLQLVGELELTGATA